MRLITEPELRRQLSRTLADRTQVAVGRAAGVSASVMSMAVHGSPITGKLLAYLGYEKVREKLYRKVRG
jgi:hypothetical protein